jgi:hypothetical protein
MPKKKRQFDFRYWLHDHTTGEEESDEFTRYTTVIPEDRKVEDEEVVDFNPIKWWNNMRTTFPSLHLYAFNTLSCPAMSTECEGVFSGVKRTITPERNKLSESVIEACECLKVWWREGVVSGATPGTKRKAGELDEPELPNKATG